MLTYAESSDMTGTGKTWCLWYTGCDGQPGFTFSMLYKRHIDITAGENWVRLEQSFHLLTLQWDVCKLNSSYLSAVIVNTGKWMHFIFLIQCILFTPGRSVEKARSVHISHTTFKAFKKKTFSKVLRYAVGGNIFLTAPQTQILNAVHLQVPDCMVPQYHAIWCGTFCQSSALKWKACQIGLKGNAQVLVWSGPHCFYQIL